MGHGAANYLVESPETVLQAVMTRLKLFVGEWFNDTGEGTPWRTEVYGKYTRSTYDAAVRRRILRTQGVTGIAEYRSSFDSETRNLLVEALIDTIYGRIQMQEVL